MEKVRKIAVVPKHHGMTRLAALSLLALAATRVDAESWQVRVPVFLGVGRYVVTTPQSSVDFGTVSAFAELRLLSPRRPWSAGLFVDYRYSLDEDAPHVVKSGALLRQSANDWDTLAAVLRRTPQGDSGAWGYFGRLRYRLADGHRLGVESFGIEGRLDDAYLMLGYYGDLSRDVTVQFIAGSSLGDRREREARIEIVWQVN